MKIIFICTKSITFNSFLKLQANFFLKKGIKVEIACSDIENLNFRNTIFHRISFPQKISNFFDLSLYIKLYLQIKNIVKKNPTALFYLHTPVASHFFRLFTYFCRLKIIYFVHGFRFQPIKNPLNFFFKIIEKILSYKTSVYITINNHDFSYAKQNLTDSQSCYKVNGVGLNLLPKYLKKKLKIKKILVIAAYKKDKGYFDILKVAETLKNKNIKIECYGYGNYEIFNAIKNKRNIKNISFNSFEKKLKKKIKNFDILLHLSKREGLPVALMESLIEGLPVICYNIRGNNDLIKDGFNGYFVNSYKEVANKIYYLNLESNLFNEMRINALRTINKNFKDKKINLKLLQIMKKNF